MIPLELLQDAVVTLAAVAAGTVVFRRLAGFVRPAATPGCAKCPSAAGSCATQAPNDAAPVPLRLYLPGHPVQSIKQN